MEEDMNQDMNQGCKKTEKGKTVAKKKEKNQ